MPNEHKCGGTGGCKGATAQLAFDFALENGLVDEWSYSYLSFHGDDSNADYCDAFQVSTPAVDNHSSTGKGNLHTQRTWASDKPLPFSLCWSLMGCHVTCALQKDSLAVGHVTGHYDLPTNDQDALIEVCHAQALMSPSCLQWALQCQGRLCA